PEVRRVTSFPYIGIIYTRCIRSVYLTLFCLVNSSYKMCLIMFVFLLPGICCRFPSVHDSYRNHLTMGTLP
ncbi:MAG TPA: hypothetical protein VIK55_04580, partial [Paludibacter sp.]